MRLFDAPHIPYFLGGFLQVLLALILWSLWLLGAFAGVYQVPAMPVSAVVMHGFLMLFGVFPFFMFGFLATTYPRWMQTAPIARRHYRAALVLRVIGLLTVYAGLAMGRTEIVFGMAVIIAGDATLVAALIGVYRRAKPVARRGVRMFNITLTAEVAGLFLYALHVADPGLVPALVAIRVGFFFFLVPTIFGVSYRMLPLFTASVLPGYDRPLSSPRVPMILLAGTAAHAVLATASLRAPLVPIDIGLAVLAWYHAYLWFRRDVVHHGLLLLLYVGFVWLGIGFALYAIHDAALALGYGLLGRGPLHALGLGFALSLIIAMVTRVTRGHSGRTLESDAWSWFALIGVQVATVLRVAATFPGIDHWATVNLSVIAAPVAITALFPWAFRYSMLLVMTRRGA